MAWLWPPRVRPVCLAAPEQPARSGPRLLRDRVLRSPGLQARTSVPTPTRSRAAATHARPRPRVLPRSCHLPCTCAYRPLRYLCGAAPRDDLGGVAPGDDLGGAALCDDLAACGCGNAVLEARYTRGAGDRFGKSRRLGRGELPMKVFTQPLCAPKISFPGVARRGRVSLSTTSSALSSGGKAPLQRKRGRQAAEGSIEFAFGEGEARA
jgi:hypothetical protein